MCEARRDNSIRSRVLSSAARINPESLGKDTDPDYHFKYIDISCVSEGRIDWSEVRDIYFRNAPSRARRVVRSGDVLVCTVRPGLQAHAFAEWSERDGYVCSTGFAVLRALHDHDPRFLWHVVFSDRIVAQLRRLEVGSNYPAVNESDIARLCIPLLEPNQQREIAQILDVLDTAIRETEALIAKLRKIKAGLLHDLLTRGIDENGELRDPVSRPDQFRFGQSGSIPSAWKVGRLRECLVENPQNGIYKPANQIGRGTLLVGQTSFTDYRGVDFDLARRAVVTEAEQERYGLSAGDVLVSRVFATLHGVGQPAIVPELNEPAVYESNMMRLRVDPEVIAPDLLFHWLRSACARKHFRASANMSNQASINQIGLNTLAIAIPEQDEQSRILRAIATHERCQQQEHCALRKLYAIRAGLMHDLLTGKVRVPVRETDG